MLVIAEYQILDTVNISSAKWQVEVLFDEVQLQN